MLTFLILKYLDLSGDNMLLSWGTLACPIIYFLSLNQWIGCKNGVSDISFCRQRDPLCSWHLDFEGTMATLCQHHTLGTPPLQLQHSRSKIANRIDADGIAFIHNHKHCVGKYIGFSTRASVFSIFRFFFFFLLDFPVFWNDIAIS